jgi:hypothetical protein
VGNYPGGYSREDDNTLDRMEKDRDNYVDG